MLILDAKPVSVYDEKAVSLEKPSQCLATSEVVKAGSPSSSCAILSVSLPERNTCRPWIPRRKPVRFREPFPTRVNEGAKIFLGPSGPVARDSASEAIAFFHRPLCGFSNQLSGTLASSSVYSCDSGVAGFVHFSQLGVGVALELESEWFRGMNSLARGFDLLPGPVGV
jgi:hypothetical protein